MLGEKLALIWRRDRSGKEERMDWRRRSLAQEGVKRIYTHSAAAVRTASDSSSLYGGIDLIQSASASKMTQSLSQ
jgi:hypothetical protein